MCRVVELPVDGVTPDDLFTVKRARDSGDTSRTDDLSRKVSNDR